eukprot:CAMPEP_0170493206 /NCGR_PEP_ID=MMETSP0208-20121228/13520_1 /TAXON_ID=197538 /ORGANISM="Strombidium inclinatum, Strain S3" /LENGTH=75 /DNA_ID=CAMNT_0010769099 /DNA_START=505 /DNA_END=732 /DNA_ORIENTATION=+
MPTTKPLDQASEVGMLPRKHKSDSILNTPYVNRIITYLVPGVLGLDPEIDPQMPANEVDEDSVSASEAEEEEEEN